MPTDSEKKAIDLLHKLPEDKRAEALDFIEFLWQKSVPISEKVPSSIERILYKANKLKSQGGPKLDDLRAELGDPREPPEGWNSTDFIRHDRDRR